MNWKNGIITAFIATFITLIVNTTIVEAVDEFIRSNVIQMGRSDNTNKSIIFNRAGSPDPEIRWNESASRLEGSNDGVTFFALGSGGGGGGALEWTTLDSETAPIRTDAGEIEVWEFSTADDNTLVTFIEVPDNYIVGAGIELTIITSTPATANEFRFDTTADLYSDGSSLLISDDTEVDTEEPTAAATANKSFKLTFLITDSGGLVGATAVAAGDTIRIKIQRLDAVGTEITDIVRMYPTTTGVSFDN